MGQRNAELEELIQLFLKLNHLVQEAEERNWVRGIRGCLSVLQANEDGDPDGLEEAKSIYSSMHGDSGSDLLWFFWTFG